MNRKERKFLKFMKKDMAKAYNMKRKSLFGNDIPQSPCSMTIDFLKRIEKEFKDLEIKWEALDADDP